MPRSEEWERMMSGLRTDYLAGLAGHVPFLSGAAAELAGGGHQTATLHQLREVVHRLRGSAGFYGEPRLSELAAAVEDPLVASLRDGEPLEARAIAAAVAELARAVAAACRAHRAESGETP